MYVLAIVDSEENISLRSANKSESGSQQVNEVRVGVLSDKLIADGC